MKKKHWTLMLLQTMGPALPAVIVIQTIFVSWAPASSDGSSPASRWLSMLGPVVTLAGAVLTAAFGGPLLSDKINKGISDISKEE